MAMNPLTQRFGEGLMRLFQIGCICLLIGILAFSLQTNRSQAETSSPVVDVEIVDQIKSKSIPKPLTKKRGAAKRGEAVMIARDKGNCLSCHRVSAFEKKAKKAPLAYGDMGEIGPILDGVAKRYEIGKLRLILVDAKQMFPETMMPSYYKVKGLHRVSKPFTNKPILTAQEVEDILAFLVTLK